MFAWLRFSAKGWYYKAESARFNAIALFRVRADDKSMEALADELMIEEMHIVATKEGFLRESAIAIGLMVKAVIDQSFQLKCFDPINTAIPATHDLAALWKLAELDELTRTDQYWLYFYKTVLIWAGRCPVPKSHKDWGEERKTLSRLSNWSAGTCEVSDTTYLAFDRLYRIAENKFHANEKSMPAEFWIV